MTFVNLFQVHQRNRTKYCSQVSFRFHLQVASKLEWLGTQARPQSPSVLITGWVCSLKEPMVPGDERGHRRAVCFYLSLTFPLLCFFFLVPGLIWNFAKSNLLWFFFLASIQTSQTCPETKDPSTDGVSNEKLLSFIASTDCFCKAKCLFFSKAVIRSKKLKFN